MNLKSEYWLHPQGESRPDILICGDGDPGTNLLMLQALGGDVHSTISMSLDSLRRVRSLIEDVLADHDDASQCPACGYTLMDAQTHLDHKLCREFPFFEWERAAQPKSEAVNR